MVCWRDRCKAGRPSRAVALTAPATTGIRAFAREVAGLAAVVAGATSATSATSSTTEAAAVVTAATSEPAGSWLPDGPRLRRWGGVEAAGLRLLEVAATAGRHVAALASALEATVFGRGRRGGLLETRHLLWCLLPLWLAVTARYPSSARAALPFVTLPSLPATA